MTFEELRADWGYVATFTRDDAIAKWQRFASEVEAGYRGTLYEYEAELSFREGLDLIANEDEAERLRSADARFIAATVATDHPMLQPPDDARLPIWRRLPSRLRSVDPEVEATWRS
jgi:hypothetical protein